MSVGTRRIRLTRRAQTAPNRPAAIERELRAGRIPATAPTAMLLARFVFAALAQALVAELFARRGHPDPLRAAARWYMPSGTCVDLASLGALTWLTRREGIRPTDLLAAGGRPLQARQALSDLGWLVLVAEPPAVAAATLITGRFYGRELPPQVSLPRDLPAWAAGYSVLVWPPIWALTEELVYLGYALPRLEAQLGRTGPAAALVALGWAWQHVALPFLPDRRYLASRVLAALAVTSTMTAFHLVRGRRLLAPIVAHWLSDAGTACLATLVPQLRQSRYPAGHT